jgi:hypothetical protein
VTAPQWAWDDAQISDDAILYRRVPRKPSFRVADPLTGEIKIAPAALRYDQDGASIYRDELLKAIYGYGASAVCADWKTHGAVQFTAWDVRNVSEHPAGVHDEEDPQDQRIGRAHALIRCPTEADGQDKTYWNEVRAAIIKAATWIDGP